MSSRLAFGRSQSASSSQFLFRSGNDAFRDAFASGASSRLSSPNKRARGDDSDGEATDTEPMDEDTAESYISRPSQEFAQSRPIKPLRRQFGATQSLPAGMMRLGESSQLAVDRQSTEEGDDEWQLDGSGNAFTPMEVS
jgi:hypothetical protein